MIRPRPRPIAVLLPGHGAQHPGMAAGLYGWEPEFTAAVDEVFALLGSQGSAIRDDWLAERPTLPVDDARRSQPLLFAIGYAMGRTLRSWGLEPRVLIGHSIGEYAAAVLAGVMDLAETARLLAARAELFRTAPPGGMYAVAADPGELRPFLGRGVVVGAVNGPRQCLVSGPDPHVGAAVARMADAGLTCVSTKAGLGFHSPSLEECCARSLPLFERLSLRAPAPSVRLISGYTAAPVGPQQALNPVFWAMQPARPVRFGAALDTLLAAEPALLVDTGPGRSLSALARRYRAVASGASDLIPLLPRRPRWGAADRESLSRARDAFQREGYSLRTPRGARREERAS